MLRALIALSQINEDDDDDMFSRPTTQRYPPALPNAGVWMAHEAAEPASLKPKLSAWPPMSIASSTSIYLHMLWLAMPMRADLRVTSTFDLTGSQVVSNQLFRKPSSLPRTGT